MKVCVQRLLFADFQRLQHTLYLLPLAAFRLGLTLIRLCGFWTSDTLKWNMRSSLERGYQDFEVKCIRISLLLFELKLFNI